MSLRYTSVSFPVLLQVLARRVSGQDAHNVETVLTETEEEYEKRLYDTMPIPITCFYAALKVFFCCIVRDFAGAKEAAATAIAQESGMRGQVTIPLTYTFSALARLLEAAEIPTADENGADANTEARRKYLIAQAGACARVGRGSVGRAVPVLTALPVLRALAQTRTTSKSVSG